MQEVLLVLCNMHYSNNGGPVNFLPFYTVRTEMKKNPNIFVRLCMRGFLQREDQKSNVLIPMLVFISLCPTGVQRCKIHLRTKSYFSALKIHSVYSKNTDGSNEHWKLPVRFISLKSCQRKPPACSTLVYIF